MGVDWGKYGIKSEEQPNKRKDSITKVDWSKYGTVEVDENEGRAGSAIARMDAERDQAEKERKAAAKGREDRERQQFEVGARSITPEKKEPNAYQKVVQGINNVLYGEQEETPIEPVARQLGTLHDRTRINLPGKVDEAIGNFAQGMGDTASFGLSTAMNRGMGRDEVVKGSLDSTAGKVGQFAGYLIPGTAIERGAARALQPVLGSMGKIGRGAITGGTAGLTEAVGQELGDVALRGRSFDPLNVAIGGVAGGGLGAAIPAIGKGIERLLKSRGVTDETIAEALDTTSLRDDLAIATPEVPTTARVVKQVNPYRQKFEALIGEAKRIEADGNLTPGREDEDLRSLWSQMAGPTDPGLDELIDLAYVSRPNRVNPNLVSQARATQNMRAAAGVQPLARTGSVVPPRDVNRSPIAPAQEVVEQDAPLVSSKLTDPDMMIFDPRELKDISAFNAQTRDVYRNFEKVLGTETARPYLESFNQSKKENIDMQEYWVDRLKKEVVDRLGIKKGSKLSGLVQRYGEKKIDDAQLVLEAGPEGAAKVKEADMWFRQAYDNLIDIVNDSRMRIYPNNPEKIVPKRSDYYRHFRELNGLEGLKNLFETPAGIDPQLVGTSDFTSPKSKFAGFMQKRGLGPYKNDAVGGFLNYIPAASYATHIDPQISNIRSLQKALAGMTGDEKNVNNFIEFLSDFANDLSGKTSAFDRPLQKILPGGRKTIAVLNWLNNRVKTNTVLGNLGSALAQTANIPTGIAYAKQHSVKGLGRAMKAAVHGDTAMEKSGFLKERYADKMYRQFDTEWLDIGNPLKLKSAAIWLMETVDRMGTSFVWSSVYEKALSDGVKNPVAHADDVTRKLVAGRGVGEQPLVFKSTFGKLAAPFQLEVANLWRVMGDFVSKKDFTGLAVLFAANYVFNRGIEMVRGSGVTFDPIQAFIEASQEDLSPGERAGRIGGELLSNLPGGQTLAAVYPEYGDKFLGLENVVGDLPTRKQLFGDNDPTRFGTGLPVAKGFQQPGYMLLPGFGGNQLRKTVDGIKTLIDGDATTKDGDIKFPVTETPANVARTIAFGPNSTPESREYFKNDRRPLGTADSEVYKSMDGKSKSDFYKEKMAERAINKVRDQMKEVFKDEKLTADQRNKKLDDLQRKLDELLAG